MPCSPNVGAADLNAGIVDHSRRMWYDGLRVRRARSTDHPFSAAGRSSYPRYFFDMIRRHEAPNENCSDRALADRSGAAGSCADDSRRQRVVSTVNRWEAEGGARTPEALRPAPIPAEENAAVLYQQIFARLETLPSGVSAAILNPRDTAEQHAALAAVPASVFADALHAARREQCVWDTALYDRGLDAPLEYLTHARTLTHILVADMQRQAAQEDHAAAMVRLEAVMGLADHVTADSVLLAHIFSDAIEQIGMDRFIEAYQDQIDLPTEARGHFERRSASARIRDTLLVEGTFAKHWIIDRGNTPMPELFHKREAQEMLLLILEILEDIEKPWLEQRVEARMGDVPLWAFSLSLVLRSYDRFIARSLQVERQRLSLLAAIDLRQYRAVHGEYPHPDAWEMPIDPLTGRPIGYKRTDDGFTITAPAVDSMPAIQWQWP